MNDFYMVVTPQELEKHLSERIVYHEKRIAMKKEQLARLEAVLEDKIDDGTTVAERMMSKTGYASNIRDSVSDLKGDIDGHKKVVERFAFAADHLSVENYRLSWTDAQLLELIPRGRF